MIDTDKYEGHMQDYYFEGSNFELEYLTMFDGDDNAIATLHSYDKKLMGGAAFLSPTIELMIGAPKLLAEVKRLRGLLKITAQSYLDDVRSEDMLGEISVKKEYETCKEIGDAIGATINAEYCFIHKEGEEE